MIDKKSPHYVKSEFSEGLYKDKSSTTFERTLRVDGKDRDNVKSAAVCVECEVM